MFDLQDENSTQSIKSTPWDRIEHDEPAPENSPHKLDNAENEQLYKRLISYYQQELDRQSDNRIQQAIDEDFYDHIQWSEGDAAALRERGQAPLVYNVIAQTVNWIIGSEKRGRADFKVLPRGKEDAKPAERKTALLKYLADCNRTPFHRSRAFEDTVKVGIGWLEDAAQDDDDSEPIYSRYESWRNMLWDSAATEMDLSDGRYITRSKWVDLDIAKAIFEDRHQVLELSADEESHLGYDLEFADEVMDSQEIERGENYGTSRNMTAYYRRRVRLIEIWFRKPVKKDRITRGQFRGELYEPGYPGHEAAVQEFGESAVGNRMMMRMHCAIMTTKGLLYVGESPYRHNRFPFTPVWGYRRGRDNLPYGVIRGLRDIQEDINKRASKALYILSTNKVIMDEGAVEDEEAFREEVSRPDAILKKKRGYELTINAERELSSAHLDLMGRNIDMIQQVGGVTDELMGRSTNATSGKAIEARQDQGSLSTSKFFDNLRFAFQCQGEIQLSLTEQFMTEEKVFRITNERDTPDYVTVNDGNPENDITRTKADFIISDSEWRASLRQAQAEQLMEMITRMPPEVAMVMLDLVVETMDLPNREELVKRIRMINGQEDPDADPDDPEVKQRQQAKAQQQQIQQEMVMAELREKLAKAGKSEAEAQRIATQMMQDQADVIDSRMDTQKTAIEAAKSALESPLAVDIADGLLREAGYLGVPEQQAQQAVMQQAAMEQQAAQQAQQAQGQPGGPGQQPGPGPAGGERLPPPQQ